MLVKYIFRRFNLMLVCPSINILFVYLSVYQSLCLSVWHNYIFVPYLRAFHLKESILTISPDVIDQMKLLDCMSLKNVNIWPILYIHEILNWLIKIWRSIVVDRIYCNVYLLLLLHWMIRWSNILSWLNRHIPLDRCRLCLSLESNDPLVKHIELIESTCTTRSISIVSIVTIEWPAGQTYWVVWIDIYHSIVVDRLYR